jgi:four helix bundle protein
VAKSYLDLGVYQESFTLFVDIHEFTLTLPKYELYEQGSQLRRSSDSVNSNIVEGYGRKDYHKDFLRFLTYSRASNDETVNHLRKIAAVHPDHREKALDLMVRYRKLGAKLYNFSTFVREKWNM